MNKLLLMIVLSGPVCSLPLSAAPTGQQLLEACEKAIANGYHGLEASMCEWYVTPCACNTETGRGPRVCLPEDQPGRILALKVIDGLKKDKDLAEKPADIAAAEILSREYPCKE